MTPHSTDREDGAQHARGRFVVVDPSLRHASGHHWQYSRDIALAARRRGFQCTVLAHVSARRLPADAVAELCDAGVRLTPWFSHTLYDPGYGGAAAVPKRAARRLAALLHQVRHRSANALNKLASIDPTTARHATRLQELWRSVSLLVGVIRPVARVISAAILLTCYYLPKTVILMLRRHRISHPQDSAFTRELAHAIVVHELSSRDTLFVHTASPSVVDDTTHALIRFNLESLPVVFLLLRYDDESLPDDATSDTLGPVRRFSRLPLFNRRFYLLAETSRLAGFYSEDVPERVHLFEHAVSDRLRHIVQGRQSDTTEAPGRRSIVALGNAREEKGFTLLTDLVARFAQDEPLRGAWRFIIQCDTVNDNLSPAVCRVIQELAAYPPDFVELLRSPLSTDQFASTLADAAICLLPYSTRSYHRRGSGVFVEALAAGVPVVVPADTWLAERMPAGAGVAFDGASQFVRVVETLARDVSHYKAGATALAGEWLSAHTADASIDRLLALATRHASVPRKSGLTVLHLAPSWLRQGSTAVFEAQLEYLAARGHHVFSVGIVTQLMYTPTFAEEAVALACHVRARPVGFAWQLAPVMTLRHVFVWWRLSRAVTTIDRERARGDFLDVPSSLASFVLHNQVDVVVLNYVHYLPLVQRLLRDRRVPVVVETIDLQTDLFHQYGADRDAEETWKTEVSLLERCTSIISLNSAEHERLKSALPDAEHALIYPFLDVSADSALAFALCSCVADIVEAAGTRLPPTAVDWEHFDLLYVGALHAGNVDALRWFVGDVLPLLSSHVTLVVAGNVAAGLPDLWSHPRIHFLSELNTLDSLYAAATVVVIPMRLGTGVSVKTIEAMARAKPFVASPAAMRGIDTRALREHGIEPPRDAEAFAGEVERLLQDPILRARVAACGFAYAAHHFSREQYYQRWDRLLANVAGQPPALTAEPRHSSAAGFQYVEWTADERLLARALKHLLGCAPWDSGFQARFDEAWLHTVSRRDELRRRVAMARIAPLAGRRLELGRRVTQSTDEELYRRLLDLSLSYSDPVAGRCPPEHT